MRKLFSSLNYMQVSLKKGLTHFNRLKQFSSFINLMVKSCILGKLFSHHPEMEFKEFEPRFKSAKTRFKLSAGLNLETFDTILNGINHI